MIREIKEETGLDAEIIKPVYVWTVVKDPSRQVVGIHYLCKLLGECFITLSHEHYEYAWVNMKEITDYDLCQCIKDDLNKFDINSIMEEESIRKE